MKRAVVKLGGSTAHADEMGRWIAALADSSLPVVIVPGGGPFADQVRQAQARMGFSDAAAHAMAILAMDQFGYVILDRHERLAAAYSLQDMEQTLAEGKVPVWMPLSAEHYGAGHSGILGHHVRFACRLACRQARRWTHCCSSSRLARSPVTTPSTALWPEGSSTLVSPLCYPTASPST